MISTHKQVAWHWASQEHSTTTLKIMLGINRTAAAAAKIGCAKRHADLHTAWYYNAYNSMKKYSALRNKTVEVKPTLGQVIP